MGADASGEILVLSSAYASFGSSTMAIHRVDERCGTEAVATARVSSSALSGARFDTAFDPYLRTFFWLPRSCGGALARFEARAGAPVELTRVPGLPCAVDERGFYHARLLLDPFAQALFVAFERRAAVFLVNAGCAAPALAEAWWLPAADSAAILASPTFTQLGFAQRGASASSRRQFELRSVASCAAAGTAPTLVTRGAVLPGNAGIHVHALAPARWPRARAQRAFSSVLAPCAQPPVGLRLVGVVDNIWQDW